MARTDDAIVAIKQAILAREWRPGERLPPEKALSEQLGLSRSSLREAVKALAVLGVLDVRQGDGTYVTSLDPALLASNLAFLGDLHEDDSLADVLVTRRILEAGAVTLAATRIADEDIARLRGLIDAVDDVADVEGVVEHDLAFHAELARLSGNAHLAAVLEGMAGRTFRVRVWRAITEDGALERTLREHTAIVDALARRDAGLAAATVSAHIAGVEAWLRSHAAPPAPGASTPDPGPGERSRPRL